MGLLFKTSEQTFKDILLSSTASSFIANVAEENMLVSQIIIFAN